MTNPPSSCSRALAVLLWLALPTCRGGAPASSSWSGHVLDSAGVTVVVNTGGTLWAEGEEWRAIEDLVIAADEARPETLFGHVADLAVDASGRIYVLDQQAQAVRVFGPDGAVLPTIGGPGEGPGEVGRFAFSVLASGDTITVADWTQRRLSRFGSGGAFLGSERISLEGAARSWWEAGPGGLLFRSLARYTDEGGRWRGHDVLLRYRGEGGADTVLVFDYPQTDIGSPDAALAPLVINTPAWTQRPDGSLAWLTLEGTEVRVHGADGALRRIVRTSAWQARETSAEEADALVDKLGEKLEMLGGSRETLARLQVVVPERLPALTSLRGGPEGTLWVQRMGAVAEVHPMALNTPDPPAGWGGAVWDVLDRDGRLLGSVTLPPGVRVYHITDDALYGIRRGAMDVDEVVRLRLERG